MSVTQNQAHAASSGIENKLSYPARGEIRIFVWAGGHPSGAHASGLTSSRLWCFLSNSRRRDIKATMWKYSIKRLQDLDHCSVSFY